MEARSAISLHIVQIRKNLPAIDKRLSAVQIRATEFCVPSSSVVATVVHGVNASTVIRCVLAISILYLLVAKCAWYECRDDKKIKRRKCLE